MSKNRLAVYKPVKAAVDVDDAMMQAVTANEVAARLAQENRDAKAMAMVAANWNAIAGKINILQQQEMEGARAGMEMSDATSDTERVVNRTGFSPNA